MELPDESIVVDLRCASARVVGLEVRSTRLTGAGAALEGRSPIEALTLAPLLFPVCGTAHATALADATERALGLSARPEAAAARALRVATERAVSHAMQLVVGFAAVLEEAPQLDTLKRLREAAAAIDRATGGRAVPGALGASLPSVDPEGLDEAVAELRRTVDLLAEDLPTDISGLVGWAKSGATAAARLVARSMDDDIATLGDSGTPGLVLPDESALDAALADAAFAARPHSAGEPRDPSSYALFVDDPTVRVLRSRFSGGLPPRLIARLVALREAGEAVARAAGEVAATTPADGSGSTSSPSPRSEGRAVAVVHTARGPLAYRVSLRDGRLTEVRSVAPTEWAFHPAGPLGTLIGRDRDVAARGAPLLLLALDPCVRATVRFTEREVARA